ncbi:MAG: hypothetical protein COV57_03590 [Candidatus Liptonbacteria bacterium CG11_big_fil_rev_8_21_14_0_20_35_14]|uniref:Uncharacterized protein n=1 Tax=Candidatus Liptonbacteria bacterium CG11_big_fil_rev_8_21_14_0_20_35_14 TaxID=1974634 RepID=A0A2H0N6T3_9BACT|nr:MAG: hypothetical protein COV57_03590 [Candidatus Liptonbacteria bacterium CG11_big_fil_rev_8_21_14_0_20_35_14]
MDQMNPTGNPMDPNMAPVPDMGTPEAPMAPVPDMGVPVAPAPAPAPAPEAPMAPAPEAPGESDGGMTPPVTPVQ